mgnify:CR=1 FL=1
MICETGHMRKLDELGRIVIPIDLRRAMLLDKGDSVSFSLDEASHAVILRKKEPSCICCHAADSLRQLLTVSTSFYCIHHDIFCCHKWKFSHKMCFNYLWIYYKTIYDIQI